MRSFLGVRVAIGSVKHLLQCSPLARGNRVDGEAVCSSNGPIPARAGQPDLREAEAMLIRAYPRSRGATALILNWRQSAEGLSPLARGNLLDSQELFDRVGPIPARAGQPPAAFL